MLQTRSLMGMHITIEVVDKKVKKQDVNKIFDYFTYVDEKFSTYKDTSEVSQINNGKLAKNHYSSDMKEVISLCEQTKRESGGYFDPMYEGKFDPSGVVKGWAIYNASELLKKGGFENYYVDAGGDVQVAGKNSEGKLWNVGIRNPFEYSEIVKVLALDNCGIATSGTSLRGQHIYNPHKPTAAISEIVSLSVIGPNVYEADRFATAAFAMGILGINFIERQAGLYGYMINKDGIATYSTGFEKFVVLNPHNA